MASSSGGGGKPWENDNPSPVKLVHESKWIPLSTDFAKCII